MKKNILNQSVAFVPLIICSSTHFFTFSSEITISMIIISFVIMFFINIMKRPISDGGVLRSDLLDIDTMDDVQFEHYLSSLFRGLGYESTLTQKTNYGAHLIIEKNGKKIVVQAKRCYKKRVGIKSVQEIHSAINHYEASEGWVITNSYFTKNAHDLAKSKNVKLLGRSVLASMMVSVNPNITPSPAEVKIKVSPLCPKCNKAMKKGNGRNGQFYRCANWPTCRETKNII